MLTRSNVSILPCNARSLFLAGWLCDLTGDFSVSFLISGSFLLLGALIILTLPGICCRKRTDQLERNSGAISGGPGAKQGDPLANGGCECRVEQPSSDTPAVLDYRIGADAPSCHHWPPLEKRTGLHEIQGDQGLDEDKGLQTADPMPLSAGKLLEYHGSSPLLPLSTSAAL